MKLRVAVIGGGASGLMAAIIAAKNGAEVCIYEKLNRVGKKILATGNGRCNFTNVNATKKDYHGGNPDFIENVLNKFDISDTLNFFEGIGIYPRIEENGKVYPYSLQASSVLDNLRFEASKLGISEITECTIKSLRKNKDHFDIISSDNKYIADKVIICTGGLAGEQYGCKGDGYTIAKELGLKVIKQFPALVQLKLKSDILKRISGVKFDGTVVAMTDDKIIRKEFGEILFTDYGISGPPILQLSREVINNMQKDRVILSIDMFTEFDKHTLYEILSNRFLQLKDRSVEDALNGLINKKLIPIILMTALKDRYKELKCQNLNKKDIYSIINVLKEWKFEVNGYNDWKQAQSTAGGVSLSEINNATMESLKIKGLYFAGEVLDVDGDCGGFNLQWAWSSGYIAGYNASFRI